MTILAFITIVCVLALIASMWLMVAYDEYPFICLVVILAFVTMICGALSSESNVIKSRQIKQAEVMKTFDALVIKAPDWPEQRSTDINFLDKPVQIVESTYVNSWGAMARKEYTVEVIPVENN